MTRLRLLLFTGVMVGMTGCATDMGGLGGSANHQCPMPEGGACQSVSETLARSTHGSGTRSAWNDTGTELVKPGERRVRMAPGFGDAFDGEPLVTRPRVMRILIERWRDSDDNLMDQRRVYVQVDNGRWRLDHFDGSVRRDGASGSALVPPPARSVVPVAVAADPSAQATPVPNHGFAPLVGERGPSGSNR